jgi:Transposase DDE domain
MVLPAILNPFVEGAPAAVMTRIALDWIIQGTPLDRLLEEVAEGQYEREFTLGHFVQVMLDVACGYRPSPRAAFLRRGLDRIATPSAFYRKLGRMELALTEEIVRCTASRARQLIVAGGGLLPEPVPGYAARVLDGNVLAGTEHRIVPLRTTRSAGLPGMSLAVYEPASGLILRLVLEEDAHCQERALLDRIAIEPGQLWIMDRNFCVRSLLFRMARAKAYFLVRWHRSTLPYRVTDRPRRRGRCAAGRIFEQAIEVEDDDGVVYPLRRIVLKLDQPTRDGETEIVLITNLPAEVAAEVCCQAYAGRWQIEAHYQALTDLLHCEVPTLGWPRAALFAFSMSAVAGDALAVLKGNLRVAHGEEIAAEVSDFALVDEVAEVYPGMMLAVPAAAWPRLAGREAAEISELLNDLAAKVPVHRMFRCRRGPKKPRPKRSRGNRIHHVSNKKLLDQARGIRAPTRRRRRPSGTKHRLKKSSCSQG